MGRVWQSSSPWVEELVGDLGISAPFWQDPR